MNDQSYELSDSFDKILKAVGTTKKGRTIDAIASKAGLSYGYVASRVAVLVKFGKVAVVGEAKPAVGRPARLFTAVK